MRPPKIGATAGASSFFTTLNQKIIALNAMNAPPISSNATENMSWGQFTGSRR